MERKSHSNVEGGSLLLHLDAAVFLVWILKEETHPNLRRNEELAVTALEVKAVAGISRPLTY